MVRKHAGAVVRGIGVVMVSASILLGQANILQENSGICAGQLFCARHYRAVDVEAGGPNSEGE